MKSIKQQIIKAKKVQKENMKNLFYVDYCNNCKDIEIRGVYGKDYTPCHHPWFCWHDGREVESLGNEIGLIKQDIYLRGYTCAYEVEKLKKLNEKKWELIKKGRRNMSRIKHKRRF